MAVSILFELNQELTRLFVAGSRLSAGDPRIKKYVAPLRKYGEKAPVFQKLAGMLEELLEADASNSAEKLIETETFLLSVLSTQGDTSPSPDVVPVEISHNATRLAPTKERYRALLPVIEALSKSGTARMETLKNAYENGMFKDPRLSKITAHAISDKNPELADYLTDIILPSMGGMVYPFLLSEYDEKGGVADGRRLKAMHKIKGEDMLDLIDEVLINGSPTVKTYAVWIMAEYPKYDEALQDMLNESKPVREEAAKVLEKKKKDSAKGVFGKLFGKRK